MPLFNRHNLAVAKIAHKNHDVISGVFITDKKTVATDSFRLLEVSALPESPVGMQGFKPFIIPASELPKDEPVSVSYLDSKKVKLFSPSGKKTISRISGQFPHYEKIFPTGNPQAEIILSGKPLAELVKLMAGLDDKIRIRIYGKENPVRLECSDGKQTACALIMPIKK